MGDGWSLTYGVLLAEARRLAAWLAFRGLGPGASVAIVLPNGHAHAVAYLACLFGGFRFVPISVESSSQEKGYIVSRSGAELVLDDPELVLNAVAEGRAGDFADNPDGECVFFTSGTTGRPKGVVHRVESLIANAAAFNAATGIDESVRMYHVLPMSYMAGFLNTMLSPLLAGGTVLFGPRFSPASAPAFWNRPLHWEANTLWLTPTLAALLCRLNRDPDVAAAVGRTMNRVFCGTSALPDEVRREFRRVFGVPLRESYGMSEVLFVSVQSTEQADAGAGSGSLLPGVEITVRPNAEYDNPELFVRAPWALRRYLIEEGEFCPLTADGAMPTGDAGEVVDGQLRIRARLKDLIIRGGLNISPVTVEAVIAREAGVSGCAVIGLPDDFWGEIMVACIVAAPDGPPDLLERIRGRCARELGEGMRPDRYELLAELPRSDTGKVQKHRLADVLGSGRP